MNIVNAFTYKEENVEYKLLKYDMLMKIIHIPFYLYVFMMAMFVPALLFISPFVIMYYMLIDFFLMMTTSMYGINVVISLTRKRMISKKLAFIHSILYCIFVMDVISAIVLFKQVKKIRS